MTGKAECHKRAEGYAMEENFVLQGLFCLPQLLFKKKKSKPRSHAKDEGQLSLGYIDLSICSLCSLVRKWIQTRLIRTLS